MGRQAKPGAAYLNGAVIGLGREDGRRPWNVLQGKLQRSLRGRQPSARNDALDLPGTCLCRAELHDLLVVAHPLLLADLLLQKLLRTSTQIGSDCCAIHARRCYTRCKRAGTNLQLHVGLPARVGTTCHLGVLDFVALIAACVPTGARISPDRA